MCGIVGAVIRDARHQSFVKEMLSRVRHRGPDENGYHGDDSISLGFARLSIVDPAFGHQPVYNESRTIMAVCNGEIYNHRDQRNLLEKRGGHSFNSGSDAEIIPHLYEEFGENFVDYLHGMFAVVVYDSDKQRVVLARDRMGIKPLYYLRTEQGLYFSSEIKGFLSVPEYRPEVDRESLDRLLTFKHIPGEACLLKGIRVLPPGCKLLYDVKTNRFTLARYFTIPSDRQGFSCPSIEEAAAEVSRRFDEAVKIRLMSDVPLGVALSGGLDSSAVAASVARQSSRAPKTFAIYTGDTLNELDFARMVADRYKTDHHEIRVSPEALPTLVPKVMWHVEEPFSVSEIPTYYLGMAVKKHVTVLLCGDGADELFGGYSRFQALNMFSMLPSSMLKWGYVRGLNGFTQRERRQLYSPNQLAFLGPNSSPFLNSSLGSADGTVLDRLLHYELTHQLPQHQLMRLDKLTMAHAVEARVPFLDTNLVTYVAQLPSRFKVQGLKEKVLLKLAMADRLPEAIIKRRKFGLKTPVNALFKGGFLDICRDDFLANKPTLDEYFCTRAIDRLFDSIGKKNPLALPEQKLFQLYLFLKWHQVFIDRMPLAEECAAETGPNSMAAGLQSP
jgi:asparagine synthase (glutamine-hydrolysing)